MNRLPRVYIAVAALSAPWHLAASWEARAAYEGGKFSWTINTTEIPPASTRITWQWLKGQTPLFEGVWIPDTNGIEQTARCAATPGTYRVVVLEDGSPVPVASARVAYPGPSQVAAQSEVACWNRLGAKYSLSLTYRLRSESLPVPLPPDDNSISMPLGFSWTVAAYEGFVRAQDIVRVKWFKEGSPLLEGQLFAHQFGKPHNFSSAVTAGRYELELAVNGPTIHTVRFWVTAHFPVVGVVHSPDDAYDYSEVAAEIEVAQQKVEVWRWKEIQVFEYGLPAYDSTKNCQRVTSLVDTLRAPLKEAYDAWNKIFTLRLDGAEKDLARKTDALKNARRALEVDKNPANVKSIQDEIDRWRDEERNGVDGARVLREDAEQRMKDLLERIVQETAKVEKMQKEVNAAEVALGSAQRALRLADSDRSSDLRRYQERIDHECHQ